MDSARASHRFTGVNQISTQPRSIPLFRTIGIMSNLDIHLGSVPNLGFYKLSCCELRIEGARCENEFRLVLETPHYCLQERFFTPIRSLVG